MSKMVFSVGPIAGKKTVVGKYGMENVSQREIAAEGKCQFVVDGYWNDTDNFVSKVYENPTWKQVLAAAQKSIEVTKDNHHLFLEGICYHKKVKGVSIYKIFLGS